MSTSTPRRCPSSRVTQPVSSEASRTTEMSIPVRTGPLKSARRRSRSSTRESTSSSVRPMSARDSEASTTFWGLTR